MLSGRGDLGVTSLDQGQCSEVGLGTVFGSVAHGDDGPDSDLDLAADLPSGLGLVGLGRASEDFEAIVRRSVDLVPFDDLKTGVGEGVEAEMVRL